MIDLTNHTVATITDCNQEPIHIPGSIQPHGYLLAFDIHTGLVTHGSANLTDVFRAPLADILGKQLEALFTDRHLELQTRLAQEGNSQPKRLIIPLYGQEYLLNVHQVDNARRIVELEPWIDEDTNALQIVDLLDLIKIPHSLYELCQLLAEHFRKTLNYDRVMIYRFDREDYTGEVLAESLADGLDPYLGLRYPASDIPPQARELYLKNPLRSINDTWYEPVALYGLPLTQESDQQLDLSMAYLRSVSPIHIQYLKNMGVGASLSLSITIGNNLWGLIACHHSTPRHLTIKQRDSAQLLSILLASQIESHERSDSSDNIRAVEESLQKLMPILEQKEFRMDEIIHRPELLDMAQATGVAILLDGVLYTSGRTPEDLALRKLALYLSERSENKGFFSKNLVAIYPDAEQLAETASGIIYQPLTYPNEDCVMWFRPGLLQTITWAGQPKETSAQIDVSQRLTPRNSFSAWQENVRNISQHWLPVHWNATQYLASVLQKQLRLLQLQNEADKQRSLNKKLKAAAEELENINWISMHDLKEPLRKIQVLASRVLSHEAQTLTDSLLDSINRMHNSARRMQNLLEDISAYSTISSLNEPGNWVDLNDIVTEIIQEKKAAFEGDGIHIQYGTLPTVQGVRFQIKQLLVNLLDNSLKFRKPDRELLITLLPQSPTPETIQELGIAPHQFTGITVRDNGVGFDPQYRSLIFRLFKRLGNDTGVPQGTGMGLAICKKVMTNHDGYIWSDSLPDQGSEFHLLFPNSRIKQ